MNNEESSIHINSQEAINLVSERARQLVSLLVKSRGHSKPPFLAEEYARLKNINIDNVELNNASALLLRYNDNYVIKLNKNQNLARRNFSCAHEIGHILLSELDTHLNNVEFRTFNPQATRIAGQKAKERLCDIAATELLMPKAIFNEYLSDYGVSINSLEKLANRFNVSIQSTSIRISEVSTEPCIALIWKPWPTNKPKGLRLAWRAGLNVNLQNKTNYMPVHNLVKYPSTLHEAYKNNTTTTSIRHFKIDNITRRLPIESKGFGRGETRYVVSLAFLDR